MEDTGTRVCFLLSVFVFTSLVEAEFHFTDDDWRSYVKSPRDVSDYDIIEPGVVHHRRLKRGTELEFASSVNFTAFGDHFHIDLLRSERFFDPDLKVKVHRDDGSVDEQPLTVSPDCFYHGFLPTHNFSTATVSICGGKIHGYIDDGAHGIFITPLIEKHSNEYSRSRRTTDPGHLIYKRTTEEGEKFCPVERDDFVARTPTSEQRQFVPPKYLEVLVILDMDFDANRQPDPAGYAMSMMHVASRRFAEPSLDVTLQIFIVDMIILTSDSGMVRGVTLDVVPAGLTTLISLGDWSIDVNTLDGTMGHWDNAVLISGKDLTNEIGNGLLGIAFLAGTCVPGRGSSVNEDTGLSGGLTIAHEMGHTLTLLHDDEYGCDPGYVMSAFAGAQPNNYLWTSCSSVNLKGFLRGAGANCMDNVPPGATALSVSVLPGAMYDLTAQCRLFLGSSAVGCPLGNGEVDCSALRCDTGASGCSRDSLRITAEGTPCDVDMICLAGSCVASNSVPAPVNGMWGPWTDNPCSRTCDCGVMIRERLCDTPSPQYGGEFCEGEGLEITLCNTETSCGNTPSDHRNEQCAETDLTPFDGVTYNWFANFGSFIDEIFYCQNPCRAVGLNFFFLRPPGVNVDGTDCWDHDRLEWDRLYKCVTGSCRDFGCDGNPGGSLVYDHCRICNGDGSSCTRVQETYTTGNLNVFNLVVTIPAEATSVHIYHDDVLAENHVAITGDTSNFAYFRGNGSTPSQFTRAWMGTMTIIHELSDDLESLFTTGPTIEGLIIEYFMTGPGEVDYEYCVPNAGPDYFWYLGEYSSCSATCGVGTMSREITCNVVTAGVQMDVDTTLCVAQVGPMPELMTACNLGDCPPEWVVGDFGDCNTECGTGEQEQIIECREEGTVVADSLCTETKPAPETQECDQGQCVWDEGEYGECTEVCGGGTQDRSVECKNMGGAGTMVADGNCPPPKPEESQPCNEQECGVAIWVASMFDECSEECGGGTQTRTVTCELDGEVTDESSCAGEKPAVQQSCNEFPCEEGECCEYVRDSSGTITRGADTAGEICVITLIADLGYDFQISNQASSLTGSDFFKIINRGAKSQSFPWIDSSTANNVYEVEYRLSGTGSFQFSYSIVAARPPTKCDEFVDATGVAGTVTGEFTSPGFRKNDKYGPNLRCWQRLLVAKDRCVRLQFNRFQLQTGRQRKKNTCQYDHLEVRNLATGETVKLCGTRRPFYLDVNYDTVLYFKTNWKRGFKGYWVKYTTI